MVFGFGAWSACCRITSFYSRVSSLKMLLLVLLPMRELLRVACSICRYISARPACCRLSMESSQNRVVDYLNEGTTAEGVPRTHTCPSISIAIYVCISCFSIFVSTISMEIWKWRVACSNWVLFLVFGFRFFHSVSVSVSGSFLFCISISRILLGRFTALINWAIKISPQRFLFSFDASKRFSSLGHWVSRHLELQSTNDGIIIQPSTIQYRHTQKTCSSSDNKFLMYSLSIQMFF